MYDYMGAKDDLLYEYAVIRFVPRVDREEFINIGLVMMNKRNKWMKSAIALDSARIKALYPHADIECLKKQSYLFELPDVPGKDLPIEEKYRWLTAVKSSCIQVSPSHPGLLNTEIKKDTSIAALMEEEFSRLFSSLIL